MTQQQLKKKKLTLNIASSKKNKFGSAHST